MIKILSFFLILSNFAIAENVQSQQDSIIIFFTDSKKNDYKNPKKQCAYFYIENGITAKYVLWTNCGKLTELQYSSIMIQGDTVIIKSPVDKITGRSSFKNKRIIINNDKLEIQNFEDIYPFKYYKIIKNPSFDVSEVDLSKRKFKCFLSRIFTRFKNHEQPFQKLER